jgi:asparagine synthase (glutamine-hydrolysing)
MCGIAGWLSFESEPHEQRHVLERMTETVACRGPDARGVWTDRHVGFGHRRLSIIDSAGGGQPMTAETAEGRIAITFCGEIYNHDELRAELRARGHHFSSRSDTEVILRGHMEWAECLPQRLNGMFAYAIWDGRTETLTMVRDRLGVKPLYYFSLGDGVVFGSEPKVLFAHPRVPREVDIDGLRQLFVFVKTPGHGVWRGVHEVRPGTSVTMTRRGCSERVYWTLTAEPHIDDFPTTVQRVRDLMDDIVRRQLVADVPCCTMLSGGLDSSAITAIAAEQLQSAGTPVRTFAVKLPGAPETFVADAIRQTPDAPFAREVATHLKTDHTDVELDPAHLARIDVRRATIDARDCPMWMGDVDHSFYLLCQRIRSECPVALSGEAADELFGGYDDCFQPDVVAAPMFPWIAHHAGNQRAPSLRMLTPQFSRALDTLHYLRDSYNAAIASAPRLPSDAPAERRMREIAYLHITRFLPLLLDRKDRLAMATGLEVRVPFTDHRLMEYVFNVPWEMKTHGGREKNLLRTAVADKLPVSVAQRRKSAYPSMRTVAYAAELQRQARELAGRKTHDVFAMFEYATVATSAALDVTQLTPSHVQLLERVLDIGTWLDLKKPTVRAL